MKRYEETLFLPEFLSEILRESPKMVNIGSVKLWGKLFRCGDFFLLIECEEIDIWHRAELEDLKEIILAEIRDGVDEEIREDSEEEVSHFRSILGVLNRLSLPETIDGGEWSAG